METILLVVHVIITISLVILVLLQRSEGGGLGIGGGSMGGLVSHRSAADLLTKVTTYLAIGFFASCLILGILANHKVKESSSIILDKPLSTPGKPVTPLVPTPEASDQPSESKSEPSVPLTD